MENTENSSAPAPSSSGAGGKEKIEKQARQLAYDTRYKVKQAMAAKSGSKLDPAAVRKAYAAQLGKSPASPPVKARAKEMLLGEDLVDINKLVADNTASAMYKVFVEGIKEEEVTEIEEDTGEKTYQVRVTDKKTGNSYVRKATRAKITELRANPNISSVEMTEYGEPTRSEKHKGSNTAAVKSGKGDEVSGKDTSIDLKKENYSWKNGFAELIEKKKSDDKKTVTGEGVNNTKLIKVFPDEKIKEDTEDVTEVLGLVKKAVELPGKIAQIPGKVAGAVAGNIPVVGGAVKAAVQLPGKVAALPGKVAAGVIPGGKKVKEEYDNTKSPNQDAKVAKLRDKLSKKGLDPETHPQVKEEKLDEVIGSIVGGALGRGVLPGLIAKTGAKAAIGKVAGQGVAKALTGKVAGTAIGAAAGEMIDPLKKKKSPLGAAAGGAVAGLVASSNELEGKELSENPVQKAWNWFVPHPSKSANPNVRSGKLTPNSAAQPGLDVMNKGAEIVNAPIKATSKTVKAVNSGVQSLKSIDVGQVAKSAALPVAAGLAAKAVVDKVTGKDKEKAVKEDTNQENQEAPTPGSVTFDGGAALPATINPIGDPRELATTINLIKNKWRAKGLKMSYEPEGDKIDEGLGTALGGAVGGVGGAALTGAAVGSKSKKGGRLKKAAGAGIGALVGQAILPGPAGGALGGYVGGKLSDDYHLEGELTEEFINESVDHAVNYFSKAGLNEYGLERVIEEVGVEDFTEFVFGLTQQLNEERDAERDPNPTPYAKVKAKIDKAETRRKEKGQREYAKGASGGDPAPRKKKPAAKKEKVEKAVTKAKKSQPAAPISKPGLADRVRGAVKKGIERHNKAREAGRVPEKRAKEFGKGVASGVKTAVKVAKDVKKAVVGEEVGQVNRADIIGGTPAAKNAQSGKGKYTPGKGVTKNFQLDPKFERESFSSEKDMIKRILDEKLAAGHKGKVGFSSGEDDKGKQVMKTKNPRTGRMRGTSPESKAVGALNRHKSKQWDAEAKGDYKSAAKHQDRRKAQSGKLYDKTGNFHDRADND